MSVTYARGFRAAGVACGIKHDGAADLALVVSDLPAAAAGVFTQNLVRAACVDLSRAHLADGGARAIVTTSGNANACTGAQGERDARALAANTAAALGIALSDVLVCQTGVIGRPFDLAAAERGVAAAARALGREGGAEAAQAILTTDAGPKLAARELQLSGGAVRIGGIAKGAGMIAPDMATTLAQVTTDAAMPAGLLAEALRAAADESFNAITVDGSTSTNDCVLVLAGGASGVSPAGSEDVRAFTAALSGVLLELALQVVADGEGAARYCRYEVTGARDDDEARRAARTVAEDQLVRCALHGADPNWGRILAALGRSGAQFDPGSVHVHAGGAAIVAAGAGVRDAEPDARRALSAGVVEIDIDLGAGDGSAVIYGSDLSPGYVRLNAELTS